MANTFDWVEIRTKNLKKTAEFYEILFGWEILGKETGDGFDYWIFDTGTEPRTRNIQRGGMWLRPESEALGVVVYILVDDIETTLKKVVELGGKVILPKAAQNSAFKAFFADPNGNMFGLWEETKK
jgi:hypothetical protein